MIWHTFKDSVNFQLTVKNRIVSGKATLLQVYVLPQIEKGNQ